MLTINDDLSGLSVEQLMNRPHADRFCIDSVASLLSEPGTNSVITKHGSIFLSSCGTREYSIENGLPLLYPSVVINAFVSGQLPFDYYKDSILQYFLLSQIKQRGEINAPESSIHYQRHLYRFSNFVKNLSGSVLDVGCDNPLIGASLYSDKCRYVGLDPFSQDKANFRIAGVAEFLPFSENSFDIVAFNTSLDHVLDHHKALEEAFRVVKPDGYVIVATLTWAKRATLLSDSVHFHHFRKYEIMGALGEFGDITNCVDYSYKDDDHRVESFILVRKK